MQDNQMASGVYDATKGSVACGSGFAGSLSDLNGIGIFSFFITTLAVPSLITNIKSLKQESSTSIVLHVANSLAGLAACVTCVTKGIMEASGANVKLVSNVATGFVCVSWFLTAINAAADILKDIKEIKNIKADQYAEKQKKLYGLRIAANGLTIVAAALILTNGINSLQQNINESVPDCLQWIGLALAIVACFAKAAATYYINSTKELNSNDGSIIQSSEDKNNPNSNLAVDDEVSVTDTLKQNKAGTAAIVLLAATGVVGAGIAIASKVKDIDTGVQIAIAVIAALAALIGLAMLAVHKKDSLLDHENIDNESTAPLQSSDSKKTNWLEKILQATTGTVHSKVQ
jgi:hypothetical protein